MAKIKSMRGELVDFDLIQIKQQIAASPAPIEVSDRKQFINNKLQRRIKKAKDSIQSAKDLKVEVKVEEKSKETTKPKKIKKIQND